MPDSWGNLFLYLKASHIQDGCGYLHNDQIKEYTKGIEHAKETVLCTSGE
jgi:hypothetical protein